MGRIIFEYPPGSTPLDPDEAEGLIPAHIALQSQLNEWEQNNILDAEKWIMRHKFNLNEIATSDFIKSLHVKMFGRTWKWAGTFRKSNKNIGVDWPLVSVSLKNLLEDLIFQVKNKTYITDEIAGRFHFRLAAIHPFPNGNGRHARLMTDIFLISQNQLRFTWGKTALTNANPVRKRYISALQAADKGDYQSLMHFLQR